MQICLPIEKTIVFKNITFFLSSKIHHRRFLVLKFLNSPLSPLQAFIIYFNQQSINDLNLTFWLAQYILLVFC